MDDPSLPLDIPYDNLTSALARVVRRAARLTADPRSAAWLTMRNKLPQRWQDDLRAAQALTSSALKQMREDAAVAAFVPSAADGASVARRSWAQT